MDEILRETPKSILTYPGLTFVFATVPEVLSTPSIIEEALPVHMNPGLTGSIEHAWFLFKPHFHCTFSITTSFQPKFLQKQSLTPHVIHALAPVWFEYVPAGQVTHVLALVAPGTLEYEPAGHETHALELLAPVRFEYDPAEQFTHKFPDKYAPGAQVTA